MSQNTLDNAGIRNKRNDAHAAAATTQQGIGLEDLLDQPSPRTARFPGVIRIVLLRLFGCRQAGGFILLGRHANPPAVGVASVKSLTMSSRLRNVRRDAVNPFERIQLNRGCARPWIRRRFQCQAAVIVLYEHIHGQRRGR